jgi:Flp pilus assembly protein TadD
MRRASLTVLSASARGDIPTALAGARAIAGEPGVSGALGPLVDPLLERARAAAARASAEGPESPAWSEADRSVEGALLVHPGSADAQCLKAELAWARRSAEAAQVAWQACADADPTRLDALDGVAMVARVRGDLDTAESVLRRSLALSPSRWQAALNLGVLLTDREQGVEAERWLRRAADLAETDTASGRSRPHLALARLYSTSERPELAAAEARLAERQEATGESAYWLGRALVQSGDLAAAEPWLRTSLARDPERVDARVGLGLCLRARGDYLGAAEAFKAALALDPRHPVARGALEELAPLLRAIPSDVPPRRP